MDYATIAALPDRHPAWRLLWAGNAVLILSFLGGYLVEGNRGACSASELAAALDSVLNGEFLDLPAHKAEQIAEDLRAMGHRVEPTDLESA